ncbi:hypothetical protein [Acinetobacter sp. P1(2025)]|uniref:hypothetical protein n=1 Tax=Acinetobacter sp. P1(2025) TaxID=3446120 RepID=UPI003F53B115
MTAIVLNQQVKQGMTTLWNIAVIGLFIAVFYFFGVAATFITIVFYFILSVIFTKPESMKGDVKPALTSRDKVAKKYFLYCIEHGKEFDLEDAYLKVNKFANDISRVDSKNRVIVFFMDGKKHTIKIKESHGDIKA